MTTVQRLTGNTTVQSVLVAVGYLAGLLPAVKLATILHELTHIIPLKLAGYPVTVYYTPSGPRQTVFRWLVGQTHVYPEVERASTAVMLVADLAPLTVFLPAVYLTIQHWQWATDSAWRLALVYAVLFMLAPSTGDFVNALGTLNAAVHGMPSVPMIDASKHLPGQYWSVTL